MFGDPELIGSVGVECPADQIVKGDPWRSRRGTRAVGGTSHPRISAFRISRASGLAKAAELTLGWTVVGYHQVTLLMRRAR